ncbi:MAG: serine/threonine protein kinase [Acaryochloridaceae cyanobacterium CSU_3_4]|nr:serine/threonine protein kinase [Acaryochloridaceae cyanobacterium CSU_3_4]
MVKDKISGQTWTQFICEQPLPEAQAITKIHAIANGLAFAHQHHLHHGDIRPDNIVEHSSTNQPMLVNMSLALNLADASSVSLNHQADGYIAPEQYQGQYTLATDIYGLTATFYTLLTGQVPIAAVQRQQTRFEPQQLHPHLSQATVTALLRGMAMKPQHRPLSVLEWMALLPTGSDPNAIAAESATIASASLLLSRQESSSAPPAPLLKETEIEKPPSLETAVPVPEQVQTVPDPQFQSYSAVPRFPLRALIICAVVSGLVGIAFGLTLRFHYQNQFNNPQIPAKNLPLKNEPFLPKNKPSDPSGETVPPSRDSSPTTIESPTPLPAEDPALNSPNDQGGVEVLPLPSSQDSPSVGSQPLEPNNLDPTLQNPPEADPNRQSPATSSSPQTPTLDPLSIPNLSGTHNPMLSSSFQDRFWQ